MDTAYRASGCAPSLDDDRRRGATVPRLLALFLALGVAYSLAAPLLLRYLNRDIDRRVITGGSQDSFARLMHDGGSPLSSRLGTPSGWRGGGKGA